MCERSPLFLLEAKSIIFDLLKRTLELFDLSLHLVEYYRFNKYISERNQNRDYRYFTLYKPCKLNYNIISDLDRYLHRLYTSCRLTKSHLRSLHAARMRSSNDYIVIDDEIYELINSFKLKINKLCQEFQSIEKPVQIKQSDQIINRRYHSQRTIHSSQRIESFVFLPETSNHKNNSEKTILSNELESSEQPKQIDEYRQILILFQKISKFYQLLIEQLYGIHIVRDSHILQPIVISIIRLLLFITNKLKENIQIISPTKINRNRFSVQQHEEVCRVQEKIFKNKSRTTKSIFKVIEIQPDKIESSLSLKSESNQNLMEEKDDKSIQSNYLTVKNDNRQDSQSESILDFDEDEFYRLANLERDA